MKKTWIALLLVAAAGQMAGAADITWGSPTYVANDTDIIRDGGRFAAELASGGPVTINGVTFRPRGGFTNIIYSSGSTYAGDIICPANSTPSVSSEYRTLLRGVTWDVSGTYTITISNLTVGTQYKVQIWASNASQEGQHVMVADAAGHSATLDVNSDDGDLGQYVIGSFTADNITQEIYVTTDSGNPFFNAIMVRDLSQPDGSNDEDYIPPPPVPGPAAISWQPAGDITNDADVVISGKLVVAENIGSADATTVNGVTFQAQGASGLIGLSGGENTYAGGIIYDGSAPDVSDSYSALISSVSWNEPAGSVYLITVSNLTVGATYLVQIWYQDTGGSTPEDVFSVDADTGETNLVTITCDTGTGLGQYAIGTFTAVDRIQNIGITKINHDGGKPALNAIQIRDITALGKTPFQKWLDSYGITNDDPQADTDGDGQPNIYEYGLGGDPTNAADRGQEPTFRVINNGATFEYSYMRRDPDESGLNYYLELCDDLPRGTWTNAGYTTTEAVVDSTWTRCDNFIQTDGTTAKFIRLIIEEK